MASSGVAAKTVVVLDHSYWMRDPSGIQMEIDCGGPSTGRQGGANRSYFTSFIPPVTKTLWTCVVETVMEYARVVIDLFSNESYLRFGLSQGSGITWLNAWDVPPDSIAQQQSLNYLAEKLGNAGGPSHPPAHQASKSSVSTLSAMQSAIKSAIEALALPTPAQVTFMQSHGKSSLKAINKGRVICITSLTPQSVGKVPVEDLEDFFVKVLDQHNHVVAPASDHLLPILDCEFVLISVHPMGKKKYALITPNPLHEVLPMLRCQSHVVDPETLVQLMMDLCVNHHELVSTVVTGIPMKEEQNAQHSSNYDVKLWHARVPVSLPDSQMLKWSQPLTPKTGVVLNHCTSAVRITPVDVNGRPTTCLTTFLMNGRSVWLEVVKKSASSKTTSHLLTSHGGEMWLHVIETARNVLEDPPSISEGVGGRVTDYRIPDFADLIRMNLLVPFPKNYYEHIAKTVMEVRDGGFVRRRSSAEDKKPLQLAKERLLRKTTYWPMSINASLLFPMAVHIDSLLRLLPQDKMTDADCDKINQCIWSLMSVEARGEVPSGCHKKGQKRDEQWKAVYQELETFIKANQHSEHHKKVLECFLESRRAESKVDSRKDDIKEKRRQDVERALAHLANFGTSTSLIASDSPMSPPPPATKTSSESKPAKPKTFLALWAAKNERKNLKTLIIPKLYAHLAAANDTTTEDNSPPPSTSTLNVPSPTTNGVKVDAKS